MRVGLGKELRASCRYSAKASHKSSYVLFTVFAGTGVDNPYQSAADDGHICMRLKLLDLLGRGDAKTHSEGEFNDLSHSSQVCRKSLWETARTTRDSLVGNAIHES